MRDPITVVRTVCRRNAMTEFSEELLRAFLKQGDNIVEFEQHPSVPLSGRNCVANMYAALNQCKPGICFICDDDVLYPPNYFNSKLRKQTIEYASPGFYLFETTYSRRFRVSTSALSGKRDKLREAFWKKLSSPGFGEKGTRCEPSTEEGTKTRFRKIAFPYIDIRHSNNLSSNNRLARRPKHIHGWLPFWGHAVELWEIVHNGGVSNRVADFIKRQKRAIRYSMSGQRQE
jgi:hypothetical protein